MKNRRSIGIPLAALLLLVTGTPATAAAPAGQQVSISLYSGFDKTSTDKVVADFQSRYPNIKVSVFQSPIEQLGQKIELEVKATGRIQADVIATGDINSMNSFKARKVTQPYKPAGWEKVPADMRDPDGYWTSFILVGVYLLYNTKVVSPDQVPTSWQDLRKPIWKNKLAFSDPSVSGSAAVLTGALVQKYGWRYWEDIAKNSPRILPSTVSLTTSIATGDKAISAITAQPGLSEMGRGSPVKLVVPTDGVPFTHIIASISSKTQQLQAARTLVDYFLSPECAALLASANRQPARLDAPPVKGLPSLAKTPMLPLDWKKFETEKLDLSDRFHRIMGKN